jgi:hypothetical protein
VGRQAAFDVGAGLDLTSGPSPKRRGEGLDFLFVLGLALNLALAPDPSPTGREESLDLFFILSLALDQGSDRSSERQSPACIGGGLGLNFLLLFGLTLDLTPNPSPERRGEGCRVASTTPTGVSTRMTPGWILPR